MTVLSGARSGKDSRIACPVVCYELIFGGHAASLSKGEIGKVVLVAQDKRGTEIAFTYIKKYLTESPRLRAYVEGDPLASKIVLTNGLEVECFACTKAGLQGFSIPCGVLDELAYFRLEGNRDTDQEILTSVRRGTAAILSKAKVIKISTPFLRSGVLFSDFKDYFGQDQMDLLVWKSTSTQMNPTGLDQETLNRKRKSKRRLYYLVISNRGRLVEEVYRGKKLPQPDSLYNMVCNYVNDLIDEGKIQWNLILDTSRQYEGRSGFDSFKAFLDVVESYADEGDALLNPWKDQPVTVEVWLEKATLSAVLEPTCKKYRVRYFPAHGNFPHVWARTIAERVVKRDRKKLVVLYLGDFDPTGNNIPEYISTVLMPKAFRELGVDPKKWFDFRIIAATHADRERFLDALVPLQSGDPNARAFLEEYGGEGLEVDAIPEEQLQERVGAAIHALIDQAKWRRSMKREAKAKKRIVQMVNRERTR